MEILKVIEEYIYFASTPEMGTAKICELTKPDDNMKYRILFFDKNGKRFFPHMSLNGEYPDLETARSFTFNQIRSETEKNKQS